VPRKARDVKRALLAKGFREEARDHYFYFFYYQGKKSSVKTKISHGATNGDISDILLSAMAKQVRLSGPQFRDLVDCGLTEQQFSSVLIASGVKLA
jgi:hypothetical protein